LNGLTDKQKAFIDEYFVDFNATRAAERAGYRGDENTLAATGSRLLRNNKVKVHISERFRSRVMVADEALSRLAVQARFDPGPYLHVRNGEVSIDIEAMRQDGLSHLIKSVVPTQYGTKILDGEQHARAIGTLNETLRAFGNRIDPQSTESMDSPERTPVASDT
jgi:phage terminase small subunit